MTSDVDPELGPLLPGECRFPGCGETARSVLLPHCSDEHERAMLRAADEALLGDPDVFGADDVGSAWEELCRKKLDAIEAAREAGRTPEEMQRVIDDLLGEPLYASGGPS